MAVAPYPFPFTPYHLFSVVRVNAQLVFDALDAGRAAERAEDGLLLGPGVDASGDVGRALVERGLYLVGLAARVAAQRLLDAVAHILGAGRGRVHLDHVVDAADAFVTARETLRVRAVALALDRAVQRDPAVRGGHLNAPVRDERVPFERLTNSRGEVGVGARLARVWVNPQLVDDLEDALGTPSRLDGREQFRAVRDRARKRRRPVADGHRNLPPLQTRVAAKLPHHLFTYLRVAHPHGVRPHLP